jgi:hypothetical protein
MMATLGWKPGRLADSSDVVTSTIVVAQRSVLRFIAAPRSDPIGIQVVKALSAKII